MSYARFGDADVYVFMSQGSLECCACWLQERRWVNDPDVPITRGYFEEVGEKVQQSFDTTQGMVDHLALHREAGHDVPEGIEDRLWADDADNFPEAA